MTLSDPIADMLTRIRNAVKAKFNSVDIPGSKLKVEMARILKDESYIRNYKFLKDGKQGILRVYLSTIDFNLNERRLFTAMSRAILGLVWAIRAGLRIFSRDFWRGVKAHHVPDTLHFIMEKYEKSTELSTL